MSLSDHAAAFVVLDVSRFPVIVLPTDHVQAGYAEQWIAEMEILMAEDEPFVILVSGERTPEPHEDQKARGLWFKTNRTRLSQLCRGFVTVEEDEAQRCTRRKQAANLQAAFGFPMVVAASAEDAEAAARDLLAVTAPGASFAKS
jgi:hypothetical protein